MEQAWAARKPTANYRRRDSLEGFLEEATPAAKLEGMGLLG